MDSAVMMVVMVGVFVGFVVWALRMGERERIKLDGIWSAVANDLDATFEPAKTGWSDHRPRRIEATVDGVDVVVDHYTVSSGKSSTTYTRLAAYAKEPTGLKLKVYREHALSGLARVLGFQDVQVGDRTFDQAFVVKCNQPDLAPAWLNGFVRRRLGLTQSYGFELEAGQVHARRVGIESDERSLKRAIAAVAAFADARRGIVKAWKLAAKRLGGGRVRKSRPWAQLHLERDGIAVKVTTDSYGPEGFAYTVIEAAPQGARPTPFALSADSDFDEEHAWIDSDEVELPDGWALWSESPSHTARRLTEALVGRLRAAAPSYVLVDDGVVRVCKKGVVRSGAVLARQVELALELAAPESTGPYR